MQQIPIPVLFPIPTDEDDFEDLCADILRIYWNRPGLERYGSRGQRQNGVDILDLGGVNPLHAAQCKLREFGKKLSPTTIEEEVTDALGFEFRIGKYGILTTAKVTSQVQRKILEINQRHHEQGLFEVELLPWGKLCRLIQAYGSVRKIYFESTVITVDSRLGSKSPIIEEQFREARSISIAPDLTAAIDEARDAINTRDYQAALLLLNRIRQREDFSGASNHDKFRVSSNLGAAEMGLERADTAAEHFLDAFRLEPYDERAKINEVLAYILKGDNSTAFAKAQALRTEYPAAPKLAAHWVISSPQTVTLEELERELSQEVRSDGEVALALSRKALAEMKIAKGLAHAEAAADALPKWAQTHLLIARATMGWILQSETGISTPPADRAELERRIESELTETLRLATAQRDRASHVEALLLRTDLRLLQKRQEEAEADAHEAIRLDSDNVQALLALSHLHSTARRLDESIRLLERAYRKSARPEAAFMYARALLQRGVPDDTQLALSLLTSVEITSLRPEFRSVIASTTVDTMVQKKDTRGAKEYIAGVTPHVNTEVASALRAYVAAAEGNKTEAQALAIQAKGALTENSGAETREFLARLFMRLEMFAEALPLYQQLFDLKISAFDSGQLLDCAARLHRDDIVIETCAELERRGQDPWEVVSFEIQYLQKYSRERAVARLDTFLNTHPGHKLAILMRSLIGVQSQQPHLVSGTLSDLPNVEELPLECIIPAIHVLRFSAAGNATVDYAYRFLRLHFDDIRAHQALIMSLMPGDSSITISPAEESVAVGSAVSVCDDLNSVVRWFVLEATDKPSVDFEEIPATSSLAQELVGKRVGDVVILAKGQVQSRTGTISQIMPKYVRRFQNVMAEMQVRFGDRSSVEAVHVGSTEEEAARGVQKVLESVKRRQAAFTEIRRAYDELPISLHLFGDRFGKNAYLALASLAQEEGQVVKCALGTLEERRQGTFALQTAEVVVVDITAVATIRLIGIEKLLLEATRFRFQMSAGTFNELQDTLTGDLFFGSTSAAIHHRDGVPVITEETAEQKSERRNRDQEFLDRLKAVVEIVPVMELSAVDPAKREPLEDMFGQYGAETIVLATNPDSVLWTDDVIQGELARNEFGVKRVWTELVAEQTALAGQMTDAEKERVVASLIGMEYSVTSFDSAAMVRAVEMSDATPWRTPLKQFVDVFRKPPGNLPGLLGIFVDFIVKLYREPQLPETRCKVLTVLLDAIWVTVPLRLPLLRLRKASIQFFGLNCVGQQQFEECFDQWYAHVPDKLVGRSV
jgi:tetratricopeptide (TPR) repeat protein